MAESFPPCNAPRRIFAPGLLDGGILFTAPWKYNLELNKTSSQIFILRYFLRGRTWFQSRGVENAIKPPPTCRAPNMSGMQLIRLGKQNRFKFFVIRAKSLSLYLFFKSAICTSYSCWVLTFAIFPRPCSGRDSFRGLRNIPPASSFNEAPLCWFCLLKTWGKAPTPPSDCSIKKVWKWNVLRVTRDLSTLPWLKVKCEMGSGFHLATPQEEYLRLGCWMAVYYWLLPENTRMFLLGSPK